MSMMKKGAVALVLSTMTVAVSTAYAAGFQLTEQSALGMGRSYAGAGIVGDDASAAFYNPAGMTLLDGTRFQAGASWIAVNAEYDSIAGNDENGRLKGQAIPAGYLTHQINDRLWAGLSMTVPFGMGTEYSKDWDGADRGYESMILSIDMNPSLAFKVNDALSIGAGVSLQYAKAKLGMMPMGNQVPVTADLTADSFAWGYNLGVMYQPTETVRLGLSYRSAIQHDADGDVDVNMNPLIAGAMGLPVSQLSLDAEASIKTPDTVMATATWQATNDLRLSGLIRWSKWSNFDVLTVKTNSSLPQFQKVSLDNKWEDTWLFTVGADYRLNDQWTVRGGIAYDKDPIADQTKRIGVIPDTDRLWLTAGASYKVNNNFQVDFAGGFVHGIGDSDLYSAPAPVTGAQHKVGEYKNLDCYLLGVQMQYRF